MLQLVWYGALLAACSFEHGVAPPPDAAPSNATLFVADYGTGRVYRLALAANAEPVITNTLALTGALSPIVLANGDLLVSELAAGVLVRYATPLATPTANGSISGFGLGPSMSKLAAVDGELWIVNPSGGNVTRLASVTQGAVSSPGTMPALNGRGLVFDATRRRAYVTECCGINTLLQFDVAADGTPTAVPPLSGIGLDNPHGMIVTPWSELFVANAGNGSIARFTLDPRGIPTPNGTITSNNLATPIDMALTPWGELLVTNLSNNMLSRFRFDSAHNALAVGSFPMPPPSAAQSAQLAWLTLVY